MARPQEFNKKDVLNRVQKMFWTKGFHACSVQDIVDAAGIGRASLYNTFQDKGNLYQQIHKDYLGERVRLLTARLDEAPLWYALQHFFTDCVDQSCFSKRAAGCLAINSMAELGNRHAWVRNRMKDFSRRFRTAIINASQRQFDINLDESSDLALQVYSSYVTLMIGCIGSTREEIDESQMIPLRHYDPKSRIISSG